MLDSGYFHFHPNTIAVLRASNETDSTLLITGSTGTGKSLLAEAVHRASARAISGRWFKINLATLSETLIESELFGHERGAFTGADSRRIGRLEFCNGGTIFLDEIGELPLRLQAKLLDFIQYKRITPVGSNREITLDVRIIAATNRNLEASAAVGQFRSDLFHRLNVFHARIPDLCLNPRSVLQFAKLFLERRTRTSIKKILGFTKDVEKIFWHYSWPGNIRELENCIEFAFAMERKVEITVSSLPDTLKEYASASLKLNESEVPEPELDGSLQQLPIQFGIVEKPPGALGILSVPANLDFHGTRVEFEKSYLEQALRWCGGQINLTSRRIGLNKVSLTEKIRRYQIDWRSIRHEALGK